ncbi:MAG: FHA domain-containing protein [Eggerthellaceae bacterium]|nr:FHA domain-containing protein [Eggerthellaceae bacterium]
MAATCPICNGNLEEGVRTCPTCGYHVLDSTQSFKPVKVDGAEVESDVPDGSDKHFDLKVVRGPQTGVDITLREGIMSLGRDPRCDIFLNDMTVSRNHAEIEVGRDSCILRDNSSFNGVWVNDRAVETCLLKSGDLIQIGAFCLLYRARS